MSEKHHRVLEQQAEEGHVSDGQSWILHQAAVRMRLAYKSRVLIHTAVYNLPLWSVITGHPIKDSISPLTPEPSQNSVNSRGIWVQTEIYTFCIFIHSLSCFSFLSSPRGSVCCFSPIFLITRSMRKCHCHGKWSFFGFNFFGLSEELIWSEITNPFFSGIGYSKWVQGVGNFSVMNLSTHISLT